MLYNMRPMWYLRTNQIFIIIFKSSERTEST